jgi:hypothetical protein
MPTLEERLQALEQEHTQLKKTTELQTIAIGALVNKATLEQLNEKYDRIFDALMAHDRFTNEQLTELREQQTQQDGKIVGLQTEMRQRLTEQDSKLTGLQTEMRQRLTEQDSKLTGLQTEMRQRLTKQDNKFIRLETTQAEHTTLLKQILTLLSERQ